MITRENFVQTVVKADMIAERQRAFEETMREFGFEATGESPFDQMFYLLMDTLAEAAGQDRVIAWTFDLIENGVADE